MITIKRSENAPESLNNSRIRKFLDDLENYKIDQRLPIDQQALPKPKCDKSYRNADLFKAFDECFLSKCYLTEVKYETSWAMDVEHFIPQNEQPGLKYVWTNLYPASHDANMMKPNIIPQGGYLDPCKDDVQNAIVYSIVPFDDGVYFEAFDKNDIRATNTAQLLNRLHNGHDAATRSKTIELRRAIRNRYTEIMRIIDDLRNARYEGNRQEEVDAAGKLKCYLSRRASFTMLMRSTPAVRRIVKSLPSDFLD